MKCQSIILLDQRYLLLRIVGPPFVDLKAHGYIRFFISFAIRRRRKNGNYLLNKNKMTKNVNKTNVQMLP